MKIKNLQIREFYNKVNRMIKEIELDESSQVDITSPFLLKRMNGYYKYMFESNKKMSTDNQAETVETSNKFYELDEPFYSGDIKNQYNKTCCLLLEMIRDEIGNYQSVNQTFGLMIWDAERNLNLITSFKRYIDSIKNEEKLDMPKTTNPIVPTEGTVK